LKAWGDEVRCLDHLIVSPHVVRVKGFTTISAEELNALCRAHGVTKYQQRTVTTQVPALVFDSYDGSIGTLLNGIHTIPYHTIPYHTISYHTISYHTIPYHTIPYHTIPYRTIPYHTIPYHTIPYHTIPYHTRFQEDALHHGPGHLDAVFSWVAVLARRTNPALRHKA
jgi:hypothetical protein